MICNCAQINLNHCWGAQDLLQQYMREREIDFVIVTEPINIPEKNWVGSGNKAAAIHWGSDVKLRVKEIFKGNEFVAIEIKNLVMISCYISPKVKLKEFTEILKEMEFNIGLIGRGKQLVLGGDFKTR